MPYTLKIRQSKEVIVFIFDENMSNDLHELNKARVLNFVNLSSNMFNNQSSFFDECHHKMKIECF